MLTACVHDFYHYSHILLGYCATLKIYLPSPLTIIATVLILVVILMIYCQVLTV